MTEVSPNENFVQALAVEAGNGMPTWTHDVTGKVYELPDDIPFDLADGEDDEAMIKSMARRALGDEAWAEVNADPRRPMGVKRCKALMTAWTEQLGLGSTGKSSGSAES